MECGTMHFGEFNALDVLATAASLQTAGRGEGEQDDQSEGEGDADEGGEDGIARDAGPPTPIPETTSVLPTVSKPVDVPSTPSAKFISPNVIASCSKTADHKVMPRVVKVISSNGGVANKVVSNGHPIGPVTDAKRMTVTGNPKDGGPKTLTVLRINKTQNADHSYAVYSRLDKSRVDEDEGYCSRSSLGSPGQCWKSDSEMTDPDVFDGRDIECDPKSPYVVLPSGQTVNMVKGVECLSPTGVSIHSAGGNSGMRSPTGIVSKSVMSPPLPVVPAMDKATTSDGQNKGGTNRKQTKIVIVSRDANLRKYFGGDTEPSSPDPSALAGGKTKIPTKQTEQEQAKTVTAKCVEDPPVVSAAITNVDSGSSVISGSSGPVISLDEDTICRVHSSEGKIEETCSDCEELRHSDKLPPDSQGQVQTPPPHCDRDDSGFASTSFSGSADVALNVEDGVLSGTVKTTELSESGICTMGKGDDLDSSRTDNIKVDSLPGDSDHPVISSKNLDSNSGGGANVKKEVSGVNVESSIQSGLEAGPTVKVAPVSHETSTPVPSEPASGNHYVASSGVDDTSSCQPQQREHRVIETPSTALADTAETKTDSSVLLPGGEKSQPAGSHKVLHGLLAAGSATKPAQTVLLPGGQLCKLETTDVSDGQFTTTANGLQGSTKASVGGVKLSSSANSLPSKSGVVYLVSSTPSRGPTSSTQTTSTSTDTGHMAGTSQCNKYIIQDDVPPVSKYGGTTHHAKTVVSQSMNTVPRTLELGTKLCPVQPRLVSGSKDSFVVLRPGNLNTRPMRSSLIAVNTSMKGLVPGGCVLPVLVSASNPAPRSLLPLATIPRQRSGMSTATAVSKSITNSVVQCPLQAESVLIGSSRLHNTTAIPRSGASLLSSHKLLPSSTNSLVSTMPPIHVSNQPEGDLEDKSPEGSVDSASVSDTDTCPTPYLSDVNDQKDELLNELDNDTNMFDERASSGCMTPITPASGQTTPAYEGRMTPLGFSSSSSFDSTPSPGGKINIKISGGIVVDVQQEKNSLDKSSSATRSIGQVGALTWQNMPCNSPTNSSKTTYTVKAKTGRFRKDVPSDGLIVELKKKRPKVKTGTPSRAELYRMKETASSISELHPLIDHDYCTFTEFSADIQSSIIATTESKLKTDRKYVKKSKAAARAKFAVQPQIIPISMEPKLKKRKYTKRKLSDILQRVQDTSPLEFTAADDMLDAHIEDEDDAASCVVDPDIVLPVAVVQQEKRFRDRRPKRRYRPRNSGDKNYVKIPGSYQDDFVYYATKKQRGRPRKFQEPSDAHLQALKPAIASMKEFEWYREMAKIDKGIKFGVAGVGSNNMFKSPIHESEVVDMVIDMLPSSGLPAMDSSRFLGALINEEDQDTDSLHGNVASLGSIHSEDSNASTIPLNEEIVESSESGPMDPGVMAEFNRLMNSMEESDQLKILANLNMSDGQVVDEKTDKDRENLLKDEGGGTLNNLNAYLGGYGSEPQTSNTTGQSHSQFLDLDDINDNDLLHTSDIGNIFGDLTTTATTSTSAALGIMATAGGESPTKLPASDFATFGENSCSSYSMDGSTMELPAIAGSQAQALDTPTAFGKPPDKRELFPDISNAVPQVSSEFGVPDLTLVNMYWNELPGLMINTVEYVRLVDIHKQILPAKDTGILKKRCQMMGLEIINCTELQRDFLIRYMNAAKSKSCVIVAKEAAKTLIGFYVDPRPRVVHRRHTKTTKTTERSRLKVLLPSLKEPEVVVCDEEKQEADVARPVPTVADIDSDSTISCASDDNIPDVPTSKTGKQKSSGSSNRTQAKSSAVQHSELRARDIKRSARLKDKKVPYLALHSGSWAGEEEADVEAVAPPAAPSQPDPEETVNDDPPRKSYDIPEIVLNIKLPQTPGHRLKTLGGNRPFKPRRPIAVDELELRKLLSKQNKRKLNPKERRRTRRLRDKIRKHEMMSQQEELRFIQERREKWLKNLEKAKVKKLEKRALTDKHNQEHCYAASPEPPTDLPHDDMDVGDHPVDENNKAVSDSVIESSPEVVNILKNSVTCNVSSSELPDLPATPRPASPCPETPRQETPHQETPPQETTPQETPPQETPPQETPRPATPPPVVEQKPRTRTRTPKTVKKEVQHKLQVVHMDSVQRGQKSRTQAGTLHMAKYQSREAMCIECNTCDEMLSIRRFLKHRHHLNNPDELVEVSLPQKLELHLPAQNESASQEVNLWDQFTQKRQTFATAPAKRRDRRTRTPQKPRGEAEKVDVLQEKSTTSTPVKSDVGGSPGRRVSTSPRSAKHSSPDLTPDDGNRHSGRVRKRKQLHPMESYVFGHAAQQGLLEAKKPRRGSRSRDGLG